MMTCAFLGGITMIDNQEWQYIILPIGILIWGCYIFFKENDDSYLRSRGIDPENYNPLFGEYYTDTHNKNDRFNKTHVSGNTISWDNVFDEGGDYSSYHTSDYTRYQPKTIRPWSNPSYKGIVKKCKRNFKISITQEENGKSDK